MFACENCSELQNKSNVDVLCGMPTQQYSGLGFLKIFQPQKIPQLLARCREYLEYANRRLKPYAIESHGERSRNWMNSRPCWAVKRTKSSSKHGLVLIKFHAQPPNLIAKWVFAKEKV